MHLIFIFLVFMLENNFFNDLEFTECRICIKIYYSLHKHFSVTKNVKSLSLFLFETFHVIDISFEIVFQNIILL